MKSRNLFVKRWLELFSLHFEYGSWIKLYDVFSLYTIVIKESSKCKVLLQQQQFIINFDTELTVVLPSNNEN